MLLERLLERLLGVFFDLSGQLDISSVQLASLVAFPTIEKLSSLDSRGDPAPYFEGQLQ